ncbi:MAG: hypothetical protein AB7D46_01750 [Flavobacteriaceae bacterium]
MKHLFLGKNWIKTGLQFGFLMFLIVGVAFAVLQGKMLSWQYLIINFVIMMLGGLVYGFLMKIYFTLTNRRK